MKVVNLINFLKFIKTVSKQKKHLKIDKFVLFLNKMDPFNYN